MIDIEKIKITLHYINFLNYFPFVFTVCLKWRLFDPKIAAWLLNPDHPPQSFAEVVTSAQLSLPKVNSCITHIPCLECFKCYSFLSFHNIFKVQTESFI